VAGGSTIQASATFASDRNNSAGAVSANTIEVNGANSGISALDFVLGFIGSRNTLKISDGGAVCATGKFTFGNSKGSEISSTNTINIANGTLTVEKAFFTGANSCDNVFAATNSVINLVAVSNLGTRTMFDFQNSTVNIGTFRPFLRNGGIFRVGGSRTAFTVSGDATNPFVPDISANSDNHLVFDDGAIVTLSIAKQRWMSSSSNSIISVSNKAKLTIESTDGLYIGYNDANGVPNCKDNTIEILSGGELEVRDKELRTYGTRNRVVVDNGTLRATTVRIGHSTGSNAASQNCSLVIKGSAPKVSLSSALAFHNNAVLRFEIPASGYSEGFSPIEAPSFVPHASTTLEVDYSALRDAGGGTVTLVSFDNEPTDGLREWLAAQETAMNLPEGTRLRLVQDENGYKIKFKARKYSGVTIFVR
jgi:hypothetical protein